MITFHRNALTAILLLLTALATPCFPQGGGRGGGPDGGGQGGFGGGMGAYGNPEAWAGGVVFGENMDKYTRLVVVSNAGDFPGAVQQIIAAELIHRLRNDEALSVPGRVKWIQLHQPMGVVPVVPADDQGFNLGGDSNIQAFTISLDVPEGHADRELSAEEEENERARFEKLWEQCRQRLEAAMRLAQTKISDQQANEHASALRAVQERFDRVQLDLDQVVKEIEFADQPGSLKQVGEQLASARTMLNELALDRVSTEARREAIVARVDELRKAGEEASTSDPLIAELEKIVAIREQQLQRMRTLYAAGQDAATNDLRNAETEMAQARVELLKAKRSASADAAGAPMHELNNELSSLIVRLAEIDARTKAVEQTVAELQKANSASATNKAEMLDYKLGSLRQRFVQLEDEKTGLEYKRPSSPQPIIITPLDEFLSLDSENNDDAARGAP